MAAQTSSNLNANSEMNQAKEKESIYNEINDIDNQSELATNRISHLEANAEINPVLENRNIYNEINDRDNQSELATNLSSHLEANSEMNPVLENGNIYNYINDSDNQSELARNRTSHLYANREMNPVLENRNIYIDINDNDNNSNRMATKTSSNLNANSERNQAKWKEYINTDVNDRDNQSELATNRTYHLEANSEMNEIIENGNRVIHDVDNGYMIATNGTSHLDARATANPVTTRENNHQETDDVLKLENIITTKGISTLGTTEYSNPVKVKENLYLTLGENQNLTLVNDIGLGDGIRLPESARSSNSHVAKLRKPIIISVSIALIIILAIPAAGSIWFYTNSKRLEQNLTTDESDLRITYTPDLITVEAITPDISTPIRTTTAPDISIPIRTTTSPFIASAGDCSDVYRAGRTKSGVYTITLQGQMVLVYCDMENGGGWTMFHNRMDGSVEFYNTWEEYKAGFGDLEGEFWWGNDHLAALTAAKRYTLRVDMSDWDGDTAYALYTNFRVATESDNYRLTAVVYRGTAGDALGSWGSGQAFSTRDRDNDPFSSRDCAADKHAGGWFNDCSGANPNGRYSGRETAGVDVMHWWLWKGSKALKSMSMKCRPTGF